MRQAGAKPRIVLETGNIEVQKIYAAAGFGFALVPESALLSNDRRRLQVRPIKGEPLERSMAVVVPRARYLSRAAEALIGMLRESVEPAAP
jgi:DNA-binding transcriptional LysR family regulator